MTPTTPQDARSFGDGRVLETDVCVVGAGAAGIVLALALASVGVRTLLLEAGGFEEDAWTTALFAGADVGRRYRPLEECRVHRFGGTTHKYGGYSHPVTPDDFTPVPGVPLATWPINHDDVAVWVDRARVLLGYRTDDFDVATRLRRARMPVPAAGDLDGVEVFARDDTPPQPFSTRFADDLRDAPNLSVVIHAVVTRVALDAGRRHVTELECGAQGGARFSVRARDVVLACHAVENARLLLDSDVPDASGTTGRHFMDHLHLEAGRARFERGAPRHLVYPLASAHGFSGCLAYRAAAGADGGHLSYFCRLLPVEHDSRGEAMVAQVVGHGRRPWGGYVRQGVVGAARDPKHAALALSHSAGVRPRDVVLNHRIEQAPNPDSRVLLLDERDALGRRRAGVHWQLCDTDLRTFADGQRAALARLEQLGATHVHPSPTDADFVLERYSTYWHHMGTTRMSDTPTSGVVDRNCRVHGVDNLYVAGSSVFCRGTFSPPTLTIAALALRLADHLRRARRG